jgi:lipoyl-dependent peroxiredoxin
MLRRRASAVWQGPGMEGKGTMSTQSGALDALPYSVHTRFQSEEGTAGTNPEELITAAHAGCFNMSLSFQLAGAGFPADELHTRAVLTAEREGVHWTITRIHLELRGRVPGIDSEKFRELAENAKAGCPVSKVLNAEITLDAQLVEAGGG